MRIALALTAVFMLYALFWSQSRLCADEGQELVVFITAPIQLVDFDRNGEVDGIFGSLTTVGPNGNAVGWAFSWTTRGIDFVSFDQGEVVDRESREIVLRGFGSFNRGAGASSNGQVTATVAPSTIAGCLAWVIADNEVSDPSRRTQFLSTGSIRRLR